jgi:hypothetical protein
MYVRHVEAVLLVILVGLTGCSPGGGFETIEWVVSSTDEEICLFYVSADGDEIQYCESRNVFDDAAAIKAGDCMRVLNAPESGTTMSGKRVPASDCLEAIGPPPRGDRETGLGSGDNNGE